MPACARVGAAAAAEQVAACAGAGRAVLLAGRHRQPRRRGHRARPRPGRHLPVLRHDATPAPRQPPRSAPMQSPGSPKQPLHHCQSLAVRWADTVASLVVLYLWWCGSIDCFGLFSAGVDSSGLMGSLRSSNRPSLMASGAGDALAQQNHEVLQVSTYLLAPQTRSTQQLLMLAENFI